MLLNVTRGLEAFLISRSKKMILMILHGLKAVGGGRFCEHAYENPTSIIFEGCKTLKK
jgi:hypothetical protein